MIAIAEFTISRWETEEPFDAPTKGPSRERVFVDKTFSGDVVGRSSAVLMTCQVSDEQAGYLASEPLAVAIEGLSGTFVMHHGGTVEGNVVEQFGKIISGSGTGDLSGISGTGIFRHDTSGAIFTLDYELN